VVQIHAGFRIAICAVGVFEAGLNRSDVAIATWHGGILDDVLLCAVTNTRAGNFEWSMSDSDPSAVEFLVGFGYKGNNF